MNVLSALTIRIPDHVVRRAFVTETVVLNLQSGKYFGLNPTAGRMLDALEATASVPSAAEQVAEEYGRPVEEIHRDLNALCDELLARGLIEVEGGDKP